MDVLIRPAHPEDYVALCALFEQVDALHRDHLPALFRKGAGPAREREYILDLIADEQAALFVAEAAGQLVGFVAVLLREAPPYPILTPRRFAVVDTLGVDPDHQRRGIGQALMARVEGWARERGATAVELNVYAFNQGALGFYRALGYQTVSLRMCKPLA